MAWSPLWMCRPVGMGSRTKRRPRRNKTSAPRRLSSTKRPEMPSEHCAAESTQDVAGDEDQPDSADLATDEHQSNHRDHQHRRTDARAAEIKTPPMKIRPPAAPVSATGRTPPTRSPTEITGNKTAASTATDAKTSALDCWKVPESSFGLIVPFRSRKYHELILVPPRSPPQGGRLTESLSAFSSTEQRSTRFKHDGRRATQARPRTASTNRAP